MDKKEPMKNKFNIYSVSEPYFCSFGEAGCDSHCHVDFYEICLIINGSYCHTYQDIETICETGALLFFRPGECHSLIKNETHSHHYAVVIEASFFHKYCERHIESVEQVLSTSHLFTKLSGPQLAYLSQLANMLRNSASSKRMPVLKQFLSCALFACFETFPDAITGTINRYAIDLRYRLDSYQVVAENVADLYRDYPISQAFLLNDFKRLTGYTIVQYRNLKRMEYAAHLLTVENHPIAVVANILNVSSLGYFSQEFKKKYGHSPKQYQLLYCSKNKT